MQHTIRFLVVAVMVAVWQGSQAAPATPQQLLEQMRAILEQLQAQLAPAPATATRVTDGPGLTAALAKGGAIELAAGTYSGNFTIGLPATVTGPANAILAPADQLAATLTVRGPGHDVTVKGITVKNGAPDRDAVVVGSLTAQTADEQPSRVTFDSVIVQAGASGGHRAFSVHGSYITITNCRILNFWEKGRDSQGIWANTGAGPYTITNNYVEASGENILFGGDNVSVPGLVPANIVVRGNTLYKPELWRTIATVKNSLEFKNARAVLAEDNLLDGNWKDGQDGATILLTARNQYGTCQWCGVDDVTLRRNTVKRAADGPCLSILGKDNNFPSAQTQTVTIDRNLCVDAPSGIRVAAGVLTKLTITNNTFPAIKGSFLQFTGTGVTPLVFSKNVAPSGAYGITGDATIGQAALDKHTLVLDFSGNVIEKSAARTIAYPAGNTLLATGGLKALLDAAFKLGDGTVGY